MSRPGAVVEGLQLVKLLGEGPFGAVWLAKDMRKGTALSVKLLRPHIANLPYGRTAFERLQTAIDAYVEITHPNVCAALRTVHQPDEVAMGLASEYLEGQTFDKAQVSLIASGSKRIDPKRLARVLYWFEQLGTVLGWLHSRGVIHGNLKPSNVMVLQGTNASQLKILDLCWSAIGVAMPVPGAETFLAPEQLQGGAPAPASDQWSLALMLQRWLMVGGKKATAADGAPQALIAALDQALKKVPDARYPRIADWAQVLTRVRQGLEEEMTEAATQAHPSGSGARARGSQPPVPSQPPAQSIPPTKGARRAEEPRGRGEEPRGRGEEPRGRAEDPRGRGEDPRGRGEDPRGRGEHERKRTQASGPAPRGFGEEPATVKVPIESSKERPIENGGSRYSFRSSPPKAPERPRPQKPAIESIGADGDFNTGELVASVKSEPALVLGALTLPEEVDPRASQRPRGGHSERRFPTGLIWGAGLVAVLGCAVAYGVTQLGGNSGSAAKSEEVKSSASVAPADEAKASTPPETAAAPPATATPPKPEKAPPPEAKPEKTPPPEARPEKAAHAESKAAPPATPTPAAAKEGERKSMAAEKGAVDEGGRRKRKGGGGRGSGLDSKADQAMERLAALSSPPASGKAGEAKTAEAKANPKEAANDLPIGDAKEAAADDGGNKQKALETACDEGDGGACSKLGDLLRVTKSEDKARAAFARACTFKRADACHKAALMWRDGAGGEADAKRADALEADACKYGRKKSCAAAKTSSAS